MLSFTAAASVTYTYDATGHLIKIDYGNGSVITYIYDNAGNLITRSLTSVTAQTITFGALSNQPYATAPFPLSATASSGLAVSFASTTSAVCTVSGSTVTLVAVGTCTIQATQAGNATYAAATPVNQSFQVTQEAQTITFGALSNVTLGVAPFAIRATASSGLAVSFASTTASVCTVSGSTVTIVAAGTCSITASQAGNADYAAATPVTQSFTVNPGITFSVSGALADGAILSGTMTVNNVAGVITSVNFIVGAPDSETFSVVGYSAALNSSIWELQTYLAGASGLPPRLTLFLSTGTLVGYQGGSICSPSTPCNPNITGGLTPMAPGGGFGTTILLQSGRVTNPASPQTITFGALSNVTLGVAPFTISATATSGLAVTFASTTSAVCTVSGSTVTIVAAGTCSITASQAGNASYAAATPVIQSFTVFPAGSLVGAPVAGGSYYGLCCNANFSAAAEFALSASAYVTTINVVLLGNGTYDFTLQNSLTGSITTFATAVLTAPNAGANTVAMTVNAALPAGTYYLVGTEDPASTLTVPGWFASDGITLVTNAGSVTNGEWSSSAGPTGPWAFTSGVVNGHTYFVPTFLVNGSILVGQTITFGALSNVTLGVAPFTVSATASSGLAVSFTSSTPAVCTVSGSTVTLVSVGTCTIQATQAGNTSYAAATPVSQSFQVTQVAQTITFGALANQPYGTAPFTVSATASSGLAVSFASTTSAVCTVSGSTVTLVSAGTCTIQATQAGNTSYAAATPVNQSFQVTQAAQTITFGALANQPFGAAPFTVTATANSGLPVSFASTTISVCTVSGSTVTIVAVGTCSITASQAGNTNYAAAIPVTQSFTVNPSQASQTITFDAIPKQILGVSPFPITAKASSGLPVSFASTTTAVCRNAGGLVILLSAGTCSITANQGGNATYSAAPSATRTFTVRVAGPSDAFAPATGSPFSVGTAEPASVVVGDFNGDGIPDLATANAAGGNVTVLLGNGSGGFTVAAGSPFAGGGNAVVVGDFNGDGIQDLASVNRVTNNVTVLLGNGSGGFTPATGSPFAVGSSPFSLAMGDFNGDGILDLAVANVNDNTVTVLLGNGSGGFAPAAGSPFMVGTSPIFVVVGDFNGDGIQDLATANVNSGNVTVLLGNGFGGFGAATGSPFAVAGSPYSLVVGDFNRDGIQDLATANQNTNNVTVLLGNGSGAFTAAPGSPFAVGTGPNSVVVGDFNGDGIQDLATANYGSNNVTVLLGNGSGGFAAASDSPLAVGSGTGPYSVAVGDFNGDGVQDIATANLNTGNVTVLLGFGIGSTPQTITFGPLSNVTYGASSFTIGATASSGLPVSFASTTSSVCTVVGSTVTIIGTGTCSITASQSGSSTYAVATPVTQSFSVTSPQTPTLTTYTYRGNNFTSAGGTFTTSDSISGSITLVAPLAANLPYQYVSGISTYSFSDGVHTWNTTNSYLNTAPVPMIGVSTNSQGVITQWTIVLAGDAGAIYGGYLQTVFVPGYGNNNDAVGNLPVGSAYNTADPGTWSASTIAAQMITFAALSNVTLGVPPFTISATASSGLPVSFASTTPSVCTVSGSTVTIVGAGTCSITASQAGNATYAAATPVTQSFTVNPAAQTITFGALANQPYGTGPFTVSATASSGLVVSFASTTPAVCTVSGFTVTLVSVGTCTIQATQAGNTSYAAATPVNQSFQVTQTAQTITFGTLANRVFGSAPFTVSATASSGLPVNFASTTISVCTVSGSTVTLVSSGQCSIQASQAGNATYAAAIPVTQSFQVVQETIGITSLTVGSAAASSSVEVGFLPLTVVAPWTAGANVSWLHLGSGSAKGTGAAIIQFTIDANPNPAVRTGTITLDSGLTLTVTQAGTNYIGPGPVTTLVSSGLNNPFELAVDSSGNVYIADEVNNAIKEWNARTQQVTTLVSSGLNQPFGVAVDSSGNVYIADSGNNAIKEWNASTQQVTTLVSSGLNDPRAVAVDASGNVYFADTANNAIKEWNASTQQVATLVSSGLNQPSAAAVDIGGNVYFADTVNNAIKEWNAATQQVITLVPSGLIQPYGVAVDGGGNVYIMDTGHQALKEWNASTQQVTTLLSSGLSLPFGVAVNNAGNVYIANSGQSLIEEIPDAFVGPASLTEAPSAGSDALLPVLPATMSLTGTFAPTSDQSWLTIGTITGGVVNFSFTADTNATARVAHITILGQQITVTQNGLTAQTITFGPLSNQVYGAAPFTVSATASSGLTVSFASTTPAVCTVSGTRVTLLSGGTCTIQATQAGNATYAAATPINQSFQVNPTAPTITWPAPAAITYGTALSATQLNATASVAGKFVYTPPAGTVLQPGTSTLSVTFTPTNTTDYTTAIASVSITVNVTGNLTISSGTYNFVNGKITGNITMSGGALVLNNTTVSGALQMSAGTLLLANNSTVQGNLQITGGGTFSIGPGHISGNVQIQNIPVGAAQNQICGATVNGNVVFQNNGTTVQIGSPSCLGNTVSGNLQVTNNSAPTQVDGNRVTGNLQVTNNTASTQVDGNAVTGNLQVTNNTGSTAVFSNTVKANLQCSGNNSITGGGNTALQKQGQCAGF